MNVKFVDLPAQHEAVAGSVENEMIATFRRGDFILGKAVSDFETAFAQYTETRHAIGVGSGLSALELVLKASGIGPGDEVITAANTFIATVLAIAATGARPVLVDMQKDSYNICPKAVELAVNEKTKAIIPVHLYGQPADMSELLEIAKRNSLLVFEDAAQAHGAYYDGKRAGSLGHAACFSFYPAKNLGAYGDGGAVVTNDDALAESIRQLRNYGQEEKYIHKLAGTNSRLDTLQAIALKAKLPLLDDWNDKRRQVAAIYDKGLKSLPLKTPQYAENRTHVFHLYVIQVENREALQAYLNEEGVQTGIHYPIPVHMQKAFESLGYKKGAFPRAEAASSQLLSLPMHPFLEAEEAVYVVDAIQTYYSK